ncbi:MAG: pyridoxine 5'-phosphate synthase, partial [Candidatus Desulfofervidus sp.]|nr:pyridoxine 5'-phosphate synthase [Candidatus Desulfofervidus sp.]
MAKLAVNVDHVATIREARRINEPDPVTAAALAELAGAEGIVVHLREDSRHIKERDVYILRQTVKTHLNLEMAATEKMIQFALKVKPDIATLVPERRQELTTEGGLDVITQ